MNKSANMVGLEKAARDVDRNPSYDTVLTFSRYNAYPYSQDGYNSLDVPANLGRETALNPRINSIWADPWENGKTKAQLDFLTSQGNKYALKRDALQSLYGGGLGVVSDALFNSHDGGYSAGDAATAALGGAAGSFLKYLNPDSPGGLSDALLGYGGSLLGGWLANKVRRSFVNND